jgi:hypothetical protein
VIELVLLLEEPSAKAFLDEFLPRILPSRITFRTISHNGKNDLQKSLPRKLRGWRNPNARFVVLHDKDSNDCQRLKQTLRDICVAARPDLQPLIRIACHELEAWYLGDFKALAAAFPGFNAQQSRGRAKYRNVDALPNAAEELSSLVPAYQKVGGSRALGKTIGTDDSNTSYSFRIFVEGLKQLVT